LDEALSSQRKESIIRIQMVLGVISMLDVASHLGSLRMSCLVRKAWRRKDEVSKKRTLRDRIERHKDIRALARSRESWSSIIGNLTLKNRGCSIF
jgi:hypothetical protein